ncbi:MerR family transcriptional regulator [Vibrio genomosp. F6]|uniref:MerR family transcriptional regulator n=1 Tax=Vibrio genomosp. F6 TaxID=723172 RepID=UPI0010BD3B4E|nr:MerR family transcriptional regulator [Vibrio genomosp. F6]TKF21654.1 MerR family transcriptional regulator [Vibrio genomosp. F6]
MHYESDHEKCESEDHKLYAIREVSELTGVKPVTLRAWQRRYNLIKPQRTEKGHRLYTQGNIETIKSIQSWLAKGISIGKVKPLLESEQINSAGAGTQASTSPVLEDVDTLISALASLNNGKAESIVSMVLKEYPLDIVTEQFVFPILDALELVKGPQRTIQKSLFQSIMLTRLISIIEAERKAAHKGKCLFVNLDPIGSIPAWLSCLKLSEMGFYMVMLDGVESVSALLKHETVTSFSHVHFFSNRALADKQVAILTAWMSHAEQEVSVSDVIDKLYLPSEEIASSD